MNANNEVLLKKVFKKIAKRFKVASKCKPTCDDAVAGFVRYRGRLYHIAVSTMEERNPQ